MAVKINRNCRIAGVDYREGQIVVSDPATEALWVTSGWATAMTPEPKQTTPYILAQSAVPVILLPAGTVNGSGQFTLGTALPYTPSGVVAVYVFAGVGLAAGLYPATFSANNVCQLVGNPATTAGAYAGGTGQATLTSVTVPGGAMGPNGCLRFSGFISINNSVGLKTLTATFAGNNVALAQPSTSQAFPFLADFRNRNSQSLQIAHPNSFNVSAASSSPVAQLSVDSSASQVFAINGTLANAADYIILEGYTVEILPG